MKTKKIPFFIAGTKAAAIFTAKQGLKLNDKTLRLKNVRVFYTQKKLGKETIPAVRVFADTDMQSGAMMLVGYSKEHKNIPTPTTKNLAPSEFAKRAGIAGNQANNSGMKKLLPTKPVRLKDIGPQGLAKNSQSLTEIADIHQGSLYFYIVENDPTGPKLCIVQATGQGSRSTTFSGKCIFDNSWLKQKGEISNIWDPRTFTELSELTHKTK
jgi:hypothetical protein